MVQKLGTAVRANYCLRPRERARKVWGVHGTPGVRVLLTHACASNTCSSPPTPHGHEAASCRGAKQAEEVRPYAIYQDISASSGQNDLPGTVRNVLSLLPRYELYRTAVDRRERERLKREGTRGHVRQQAIGPPSNLFLKFEG